MSQIIQFSAPSGQSGITASLFNPGVDTVVATCAAATEGTYMKGQYFGTFSGVAIGIYQIIPFLASGFSIGDYYVNITSSSGTFVATDLIPTVQATVTIPAAAAYASQVPSLIPITTYNTVRLTLPVMGTITGYSALVFTIKSAVTDADSAALIQITQAGGLLTANGAAASSSALGSLTVSDASAGTVLLYIDETITALLAATNGVHGLYVWDCKWKSSGDWQAPIGGQVVVTSGVGRVVT